MGAWTGFIWPKTRTCFGSLWTRLLSCKFQFPWQKGWGFFFFCNCQFLRSVHWRQLLQWSGWAIKLMFSFMCRTFGVYTLRYKQSSSPLNSFLNTSSWAQVGPSTRASLMPSQESAGWGAYRRLNCEVSVCDLNTGTVCRPLRLNVWPWSMHIFLLFTVKTHQNTPKGNHLAHATHILILLLLLLLLLLDGKLSLYTPWMHTEGVVV